MNKILNNQIYTFFFFCVVYLLGFVTSFSITNDLRIIEAFKSQGIIFLIYSLGLAILSYLLDYFLGFRKYHYE